MKQLPDRFTADPDPVQVGHQVKICYDFASSGGATDPVPVLIDYDPDSVQDTEHLVDKANPCFTVTVPAGAMGILLVDNSGQSQDHSVTVTP